MKNIFLVLMIVICCSPPVVFGQNTNSNLEYNMSIEEQIMLFGGFAIAVVGIFLFLARDTILQKKTRLTRNIIRIGQMIM